MSTIPNQHRTDEELTTYSRTTFHEHSFAAKTKRWLEKGTSRKNSLLILVLVGTCMVIGDGILTPAISGNVLFSDLPYIYFLFSLSGKYFIVFNLLQFYLLLVGSG